MRVIAGFLESHPEYELCGLPALPGLGAGHPEWIGAPDDLRRTGRFWPHTGSGHGHFYALLRRRGDAPEDLPIRWTGQDIPGRILRLYEKMMAQVLEREIPLEGLALTKGDDCYIMPMEPNLLGRVPVLRQGWWVASLRHDRVQPDHALAMALHPDGVQMHVSLQPMDQRLSTFIEGGFWLDDGPAGLVLVTVDGFPLGWGKRDGNRIRSRYPVHLRRAGAFAPG